MNKRQEVEREVFELIGDSYASNSVITVKALDAACAILDQKFGKEFSKTHPDAAIAMTETLMKNIRLNDFHSTIKNGIGEYLDALRIVILEKDFPLSGHISVEIPGEIRVEN